MSLPAADDLFRPTSDAASGSEQESPKVKAVPDPAPRAKDEKQVRRSSGRVRHDEKMTVYVTAEELLEIEHARLSLRRDHGLAVDRGRLVREALAIALADLEQRGDESDLVRRLIG